jgi:hypothetical protein
MKHIRIKAIIGTVMLTLFLMGCSKILDEQPRSLFTPDFFKSTAGVNGGLTSMYANLRYVYGNPYIYDAAETSTDECTWGASGAGASFNTMDLSSTSGTPTPITPVNSDANGLWANAFTSINTASGVIENATSANKAAGKLVIDTSLIAEANFFRAFNYFVLVQTFGGVPLDLGAGVLKFNVSTVRVSVRNTVPDVYTKAIFPDLLQAIQSLQPKTQRQTGVVTRPVAQLYLAKAYLTYGWWLENPNNIPTYPTAARTDPNGQTAKWYYQQAYNLATTAIANPGVYGLQATYYDVNVGTNDRNNEIMLYADHTQQSQYYNGGSLTYSNSATDNYSVWMLTFSYPNLTSSKSSTSWTFGSTGTTVNSIQRIALQGYGRPWVRMAPCIDVLKNTFADKTNDSRYDGTFQTVLRGDWQVGDPKTSSLVNLYNANYMKVYEGDPILTFLNNDTTGVDYSNSVFNSSVGVGALPTRADFIMEPSAINRTVYPNLWKLGEYRTDNGSGLGYPNAGSTRPFNIAKFSELYFIAAEAAVKLGDNADAYKMINVIRARAGKWRWNNNGNSLQVADNSAAMKAATPATITIDYILAERSREYYGEGYRWYDLVRTQEWNNLSNTYRICGLAQTAHTPTTYTRNIQPYNYLRPIPQTQIDAMDMSASDKAAYQNPGY